jgi:hypothetical protein
MQGRKFSPLRTCGTVFPNLFWHRAPSLLYENQGNGCRLRHSSRAIRSCDCHDRSVTGTLNPASLRTCLPNLINSSSGILDRRSRSFCSCAFTELIEMLSTVFSPGWAQAQYIAASRRLIYSVLLIVKACFSVRVTDAAFATQPAPLPTVPSMDLE